jgi:hypothetical protein
MGKGIAAAMTGEEERLDILGFPPSGRSIADMSDGAAAGRSMAFSFREYPGNETGSLADGKGSRSLRESDSAPFLSPVLQGTKTGQDRLEGILDTEYTENAAFFMQGLETCIHLLPDLAISGYSVVRPLRK